MGALSNTSILLLLAYIFCFPQLISMHCMGSHVAYGQSQPHTTVIFNATRLKFCFYNSGLIAMLAPFLSLFIKALQHVVGIELSYIFCMS